MKMMQRLYIFFAVFALLLNGCSGGYTVTKSISDYPTKAESAHIDVYTQDDKVPKNIEIIGTVEYDDTGFSSVCGYSDMLLSFASEARKIGGDAIKLISVQAPDWSSSCYRGEAHVLKYFYGIKKPIEKVKENPASKQEEPPEESSKNETENVEEKSEAAMTTALKNPVFVAVLETVSNGVIQPNENQFLTNVLREEAVKTLDPSLNYTIMTRENILAMLPPDKNVEDCEGACLVETGRNIAANYVVQAVVNTFGSSLTITVELYDTKSGKLMSSFNAKKSDIDSLEIEIREKAPQMFQQVFKIESSQEQ